VEILYNEYQFAASFAVASLLALLALVTLGLKQIVEWRQARERAAAALAPEPTPAESKTAAPAHPSTTLAYSALMAAPV
jgi:sulfate transport system permease protein